MNEEEMMIAPMADDDIAIMPEDEEVILDPVDQYLLNLIEQLESEV